MLWVQYWSPMSSQASYMNSHFHRKWQRIESALEISEEEISWENRSTLHIKSISIEGSARLFDQRFHLRSVDETICRTVFAIA
jgi:hypothetical protein